MSCALSAVVRVVLASDLKECTKTREGETKLGQLFAVVPASLVACSPIAEEVLRNRGTPGSQRECTCGTCNCELVGPEVPGLGRLDLVGLRAWLTSQSAIRFVVLGVPEDIGPRANFGRGGAKSSWKPALDSLCNVQSNQFLSGSEFLILGSLFVCDLLSQDHSTVAKMRETVTQIDERLWPIIRSIVGAGKIPVVIGGGHNNAFPIMKGSAFGLADLGVMQMERSVLNVINLDPHSDFRRLEGRHSGNPFSYAFEEGFLNKYVVLGLHENYNTQHALSQFSSHPDRLKFITYEDIFVKELTTFRAAVRDSIDFTQGACGLEIDVDAIENVPASARTSSGLEPLHARQFAHCGGSTLAKLVYLHIAEAAPVLSHIKVDYKTGKLITYIITDFAKAVLTKTS
ncbi:arginase family hydrolase [Pelomyxa schiedti]|nr:arginase family hydrolase [Pelomyxa schiedti]